MSISLTGREPRGAIARERPAHGEPLGASRNIEGVDVGPRRDEPHADLLEPDLALAQ